MPTFPTRHVAVSIDRPYEAVAAYLFDRARYGEWAEGLGSSLRMIDETTGAAVTPFGEARIEFAPNNSYGILDHHVVLADGRRFYAPMRVTRNGDGADVSFIVIANEGEEALEADAAAVQRDLDRLKNLLEAAD